MLYPNNSYYSPDYYPSYLSAVKRLQVKDEVIDVAIDTSGVVFRTEPVSEFMGRPYKDVKRYMHNKSSRRNRLKVTTLYKKPQK